MNRRLSQISEERYVMYEYLKVLFGKAEDGSPVSLTFDQLVEKLGANKEIKLVNLADGGYVSKDKFDAKETELNGVKAQLETANTTIQSYKDMDIDGIKQSAADWEKKYQDETAALQKQLDENARTYAQNLFLKGYKFSSLPAEEGIRAAFAKKNFPFEDGKFLGATEFMEGLMNDEGYKNAFVIDAPPQPPEPKESDDSTPPPPKFSSSKQQTPPPPKKKSLLDLMKFKNENPEAAIDFD